MWVLPILALAFGQSPRAEAADLVNRLASARFADRSAASAALEGMGSDALPALRAVSNSTDADLRARVQSLLAKIQSNEVTRASLVRLDRGDRPLDEVLKDSENRWPNRLAWHPDTPRSVRQQQVSFGDPAPLPFWSAIDRLCRSGGLYYIPGSPGGPGSAISQFRLFLAPGTANCPRSDSGPLRFELTGISHYRTINLIPNATSNSDSEVHTPGFRPPLFGESRGDFKVALRVLAEPRMLISRIGQARITEAVDDRGQSLLPGGKPHVQASGGGSIPAQACTFIRLSLVHPERAGTVIKRLRITLPVEVVSRIPGPLVVALAHARGKTFRHGQMSLQILDVKIDSSGPPSIDLKLGMDEELASRLTHALPLEPPLVWGQLVRPEITDNLIQIFDEQGRQFPWTGGGDYTAGGASVTARLQLCPEGGTPVSEPGSRGVVDPKSKEKSIPSELHCYELARAIVPATVEFNDIPLP